MKSGAPKKDRPPQTGSLSHFFVCKILPFIFFRPAPKVESCSKFSKLLKSSESLKVVKVAKVAKVD